MSNSKILSSLRQSHRLLVRYAGQTLVLLLIEIGLSIGLSVLILLTLLIVGGILLGIGYGIYSIAQLPGALIYSIPVGLAFLAGLIIAAGIFTALISVYWTLAYQILTRKHDLRKI